MTISAQIILDSVSPTGQRLTTVQLRYPRFIHPEVLTHRDFSRNGSSSRAVPVERMIQDIIDDPALPVHLGKNRPGMQAHEQLDEATRIEALRDILEDRDRAIAMVRRQIARGLHKQIANRYLEPWAHINVVVSSTQWANFFALRDHRDAQPEFEVLAQAIRQAMDESTPKVLLPGEWHLPYTLPSDVDTLFETAKTGSEVLEKLKQISVARCARVSYLTHDLKPTTPEQDLALYQKLVGSSPLHASPAEHQASPDEYNDHMEEWEQPELHGNFNGWIQFRKTLPYEYVEQPDYQPFGRPEMLFREATAA